MVSKHPGLAIAACLKSRTVVSINYVLDNFTKVLARQVSHTLVQLPILIKDAVVELKPA